MRKKPVDLSLWDLREGVNNQLVRITLDDRIVRRLEAALDHPLGHVAGARYRGKMMDVVVDVIQEYNKE